MLAKLLRHTIAIQLLLGLLLGLGLATWWGLPLWAALAGAAFLPFGVLILLDTYTGWISRGPEPWGDWIKSVVGEYSAGFVIFLFRQPWTTKTPSLLLATGGTQQVPVVLIHGYMCNHRIWDDIADALRARGHDVFAVNLEPLFTSIDNYAPIVESAVQGLLTRTGQRQVSLVGHSMGGLAIRAWLRVHGSAHVAKVLTLGSPHVGTRIPQHMPTPNGRQMGWGSDWLKQLAAQETPATLRLFQVAITPQDNIVYPQRAQVLPGCEPRVFEGIGHVQMCIHPDVIQWVQEQLSS